MFDHTAKYWFDRNDDNRTQRRKKQRFIRNQSTGLSCLADMFTRRKSYQVLFITLNISKRFREDVRFKTMQGLRRRLFQRIKDARRGILSEIHGLIWRMEQGDDGGGHHLHLIVFVSVSRRDHVSACDEFGDYWVENVTNGWGDYDNGNRYAHSYRNRWGVAVGYVHRDDAEKREALRKVIGLYMAKVSQMPDDRDDEDNLFGVRHFDW